MRSKSRKQIETGTRKKHRYSNAFKLTSVTAGVR